VKEVDSIVGSYFVGTVIKNMLLLIMIIESKAPILLEQENPFDEYLELQYISALKNKFNDGRHFKISSD